MVESTCPLNINCDYIFLTFIIVGSESEWRLCPVISLPTSSLPNVFHVGDDDHISGQEEECSPVFLCMCERVIVCHFQATQRWMSASHLGAWTTLKKDIQLTSFSSFATSLRSPRIVSKFSTIVLISLFTCTLETTPSASAFDVPDILQFMAQSGLFGEGTQQDKILWCWRCHCANACSLSSALLPLLLPHRGQDEAKKWRRTAFYIYR